MRQAMISYRAKPESADENARLIGKVFEELRQAAPQGVRYLVLRLEDDSFVHLVTGETEEGTTPLTRLSAFEAFRKGAEERWLEKPHSRDATIIGNYRMLGK